LKPPTADKNTSAAVTVNPLSSALSLKERAELALSTKEKARRDKESPIVKSLFDFKGNSRHKSDVTVADIQ